MEPSRVVEHDGGAAEHDGVIVVGVVGDGRMLTRIARRKAERAASARSTTMISGARRRRRS